MTQLHAGANTEARRYTHPHPHPHTHTHLPERVRRQRRGVRKRGSLAEALQWRRRHGRAELTELFCQGSGRHMLYGVCLGLHAVRYMLLACVRCIKATSVGTDASLVKLQRTRIIPLRRRCAQRTPLMQREPVQGAKHAWHATDTCHHNVHLAYTARLAHTKHAQTQART